MNNPKDPITDLDQIAKLYELFDWLREGAGYIKSDDSGEYDTEAPRRFWLRVSYFDDSTNNELLNSLTEAGCVMDESTYNGVGSIRILFPYMKGIRSHRTGQIRSTSYDINRVQRIVMTFDYLVLEREMTGDARLFLRRASCGSVHFN